jgi:hypothetical protein
LAAFSSSQASSSSSCKFSEEEEEEEVAAAAEVVVLVLLANALLGLKPDVWLGLPFANLADLRRSSVASGGAKNHSFVPLPPKMLNVK